MYCTIKGLSKPYFALISAMVSADICGFICMAVQKSPGASCKTINDINEINNKIKGICINLFSKKLFITDSPYKVQDLFILIKILKNCSGIYSHKIQLFVNKKSK